MKTWRSIVSEVLSAFVNAETPWWMVLPFAGLLACIATFPLLPKIKHLWHHNWFQLVVAQVFGLPVAIMSWQLGLHAELTHAIVEWFQFVCLLGALYVVAGGIHLSGDIRATPGNNVKFLAVGGLLASFIGTTGAAMLLIGPIINTNMERQHKVHTIVFTILIIANCGGLLTPLGDPPLFLGMLRGVPFWWTLQLLPQWLFVNSLLLLSYYALDIKMYCKESPEAILWDNTAIEPLRFHGKMGFALLACIILAVAKVPSVDLHAIHEHHAHWWQWVPWRELVMISVSLFSLKAGPRQVRYEMNKFEWTPILEVAALFSGIFLAMVPALKVLAEVAPTLPLTEMTYYFFTGGLSAVLDNAPTYVTFFEMACEIGGAGVLVAGVPILTLKAISLGAVFFGALTYIGNGPNFMVKSIADNAGIEMPSFVGYMAWSIRYLGRVLVVVGMIFIAKDGAVIMLGWTATSMYVCYKLLAISLKWGDYKRALSGLRVVQDEADVA